jgi:hypothetical protein
VQTDEGGRAKVYELRKMEDCSGGCWMEDGRGKWEAEPGIL